MYSVFIMDKWYNANNGKEFTGFININNMMDDWLTCSLNLSFVSKYVDVILYL